MLKFLLPFIHEFCPRKFNFWSSENYAVSACKICFVTCKLLCTYTPFAGSSKASYCALINSVGVAQDVSG